MNLAMVAVGCLWTAYDMVKWIKATRARKEEDRFTDGINCVIRELRESGYVWYYDDLLNLVPFYSYIESRRVIQFLLSNGVIIWTGSRYELADEYK